MKTSIINGYINKKEYGIIVSLFSLVGLIATIVIFVEKLKLNQNADYVASCTINETFSCNNVMTSWQASAFGFPNMYIGLIGFSVCIIAGLFYIFKDDFLAKNNLHKPLLVIMLAGFSLAACFTLWLAYSAIFSIAALCIYCMIVWACITVLLISTISKKFYLTRIQNIILIILSLLAFTGVIVYQLIL